MKKRTYSPLGYIMNFMGIHTLQMAQAIHVDASLISKWKTGNRSFSDKTLYFEDVVNYILHQAKVTDNRSLKKVIINFYPHEKITENNIEKFLRQILSDKKDIDANFFSNQLLFANTNTVSTVVFENNTGKREAIKKLLDYTETLPVPGELLFLDAEEFSWLLEDKDFAHEFCQRIVTLLDKGFKAKFIIHYASYREKFIKFFITCSPLIFNRNITWYYCHYFNPTIFNISFFILNKAVSMVSLSSNGGYSTTTIFTDISVVLRHKDLVCDTLRHCSLFFTDFKLFQFENLLNDLYKSSHFGAFYSFLPVPAIFSLNKNLLIEILRDNNLEQKDIDFCLKINDKFRKIISQYFLSGKNKNNPFIYIFQLEKLLNRAYSKPFVSTSLTLFCNRNIILTPQQYAKVIRSLANDLEIYPNLQIFLASKKDKFFLPSINCWCQENSWMIQMDKTGFRFSDDASIISAAITSFILNIQHIPPIRREKSSVKKYLLNIAEEIEAN